MYKKLLRIGDDPEDRGEETWWCETFDGDVVYVWKSLLDEATQNRLLDGFNVIEQVIADTDVLSRLPDDALISLCVRSQTSAIFAQPKFANNPLALPARTSNQRKYDDLLWQEILSRKLQERVISEVRHKLRT